MNLKEFTLHLIEPNPLIQQLRQHFYATDPSVYANAHFLTDTFDEKFQFLNSNFIKIFQAVEQQHPDKMKDNIFFFDQVSRIGPHGLSTIAFYPPVKLLASDEQLAKWEKLILEGRLVGAYAQTEVAHGSDVQSLQTKAVYNNEKKCFVFNSPGTGATKFWVGVLGMHATHIVTQAQTFINGKHYGLQTFVVPVRDTKTYKLYDGIEAGDIGAKLGLPYMDNGYLRFTNYHVPRENLLMKFLKVNEDGQVTAQGDKNAVKIGYGGMLGLRVMLIKEFIRDGYKGITTLYRGLKTAGQLGPIQRRKLLQEFGYIYAGFSTVGLVHKMHKKILQTIGTNLKEALADLDEFHIFVSGFKAFYAWECVEQLRKSTAERSVGNLMVGGTAHIYGDRVPAVTYEGDNVVMLQQTARGICKYMRFVESEKFSRIPHTFKFLAELRENLNKQPEEIKAKVGSAQDLLNLDKIEEVINVIGLFNANENYEQMKQGVISGESMNKLWNEKLQKSMVDMGLRVTRGLTFKMAKTNLTNENTETGLNKKDLEIVQDLLRIYGLNILQKDLGVASRFNIGASPDKLESFVKQAQEIVFKRLEGSVEYIGDSSPFSEDDLFYVRDYKQWAPRDTKKERLENSLKEQAAKVQQCINSFSKL